MNTIEKGKKRAVALMREAWSNADDGVNPVMGQPIARAMNLIEDDIRDTIEQTANARALEVLKGLVVRIRKDAEYTNPKDDLEKIGELARSTGALKAAHRLHDRMSELLDKG